MRWIVAALALLFVAPAAGSAPGPEFGRLVIVNRAYFPITYTVYYCPFEEGQCPDLVTGEVPANSRARILGPLGEEAFLPRDAVSWDVTAFHPDLPCSESRVVATGRFGTRKHLPRRWKVRFRPTDFIECLADRE